MRQQYPFVRVIDEQWLVNKGQTVRPQAPPRALYERLKFVAGLVTDAPCDRDSDPRLLWRDERHDVVSLALPAELTIGRDAECGLTFADARVSRRHCRITLLRGVAWVSDLGSTNGTFHNGARLDTPAPLRDGDVIEVGGSVLVFVG